ncbi:septum site-determining protein MinC [Oricola cellulosilytica]|uniref:Probable septum site-determining protein MinC n=1 Tax=Oricola cellulosilytica TaxID=1429082 RepID=A0A4R0PD84_9HYPH|nr:septum site-determining protein MinC [Oricola cellulosilytica]TCD15450.1 septum formation inhibitor MinC [Oricola cellulosilytica]
MTEVLTTTNTRSIRLKGRSFLALVLSPDLPFEDWLMRLDDLAARSAGFFLRRPIVLDVEGLEIDLQQLRDLLDQLGRRNVRIMGIEGAHPSLLGADMPPAMTGGRPASDFEATEAETPAGDLSSAPADVETSAPPAPLPSNIVTQPVRSGQSLMFDGDVTIVGSVASGAEVVAGGSIHVYGTLRGRAEAGAMGNVSARIFCRKLEAELVAIAGFYKTAEDMEPGLRGRPVQLWFEDDAIRAETLG